MPNQSKPNQIVWALSQRQRQRSQRENSTKRAEAVTEAEAEKQQKYCLSRVCVCVCVCACYVSVLRVFAPVRVCVCMHPGHRIFFCQLCVNSAALAVLPPPLSAAATAQRKGFKIVHKNCERRRAEGGGRESAMLCSLFLIVAGHTIPKRTHVHMHVCTYVRLFAVI